MATPTRGSVTTQIVASVVVVVSMSVVSLLDAREGDDVGLALGAAGTLAGVVMLMAAWRTRRRLADDDDGSPGRP